MVDAVDEMLLVQRGKELGYKLSDEQFKSVVDNIRRENKLETDEQFQAALKQENMTMADLRRNLERNDDLSQRVQQNEVIGKVAHHRRRSAQYYDAHLSEFTTPPSITLREILVARAGRRAEASTSRPTRRRRRRPTRSARACVGGENFEKLRRRDLGRAVEGQRRPHRSDQPDRSVARPAQDDRADEGRRRHQPLRTPRGYQILKLESSDAATDACRSNRRASRSASACSPTSASDEFEKYLEKLRARRSSSGRTRTSRRPTTRASSSKQAQQPPSSGAR